ncbi:MAG TPA: hypothetical protein VKT75_15315 [Acidobacteriaceae bacterium]|nr:hypothetical protein [Acidobacteriaceae bacterium]
MLILAPQFLHIRNRNGQLVALEANEAQERFEQNAGKRNIVLKARQMGITTWIAGRFFLKTITHPGTVTALVAHTQEAAEQIFGIVRRFLDHLPEQYREGALKNARASQRRIVFPALDSEYLVETAGDTNAGRGLTITNLHCTEVARWKGPAEETLYGLRATLSPAGEMTMESTPNGAAGCFWKEWQEAENTGTVKHFFPWWMERGYTVENATVAEESLDEAERELMARENLKPGQIAYRRNLRARFRALAKQEYAEDPNACFLASGECAFELEAIEKRLKEVTEPVESRMNGGLRIWLPPQPDRRYLVAVDPAGGSPEGDYTAMQVLDMESGMQCAELEMHLRVLESAKEAAALAREYRNALLVVERNNHGSGVLAHLQGIYRYEPLYCDDRGNEGFLTQETERTDMISLLGAVLAQKPERLLSERLLLECRNFVRNARGRYEAGSCGHDDGLMAMAIGLAVREKMTVSGRDRRVQ